MSEYDVSVIVPIYNAEKYLEQCIQSILAQTKDRLQLVLVDDGSTDSSPIIVDQYANEQNVIVVHKKNSGLIKARIEGIMVAEGKYIGWVDADDFIENDMFEKLYNIAVSKQSEVVYCDYYFEPHKVSGKEKWYKPFRGTIDWHLIERNTQCWNKLIARELIDRIDLIDLYQKCDEYANIALLLYARNLTSIDEKLYHYRVGIQSVSGGSFCGKTKRFTDAVGNAKRLPEMIKGTKYETELAAYFDYRVNYTLIQLAIVNAVNCEKAKYKHAVKELHERKFHHNPMTKKVLDENHGKLKSLVLRWGIPAGYPVARLITKVVF